MQEMYCIKRGCYYHGPENKCPDCGGKTKRVHKGNYLGLHPNEPVLHDGFTIAELTQQV